MAAKPMLDVNVTKVTHVTVSGDGLVDALIGLEIEGDADLQLRLSPSVLAALEAMLAHANVEQARHQPIQ